MVMSVAVAAHAQEPPPPGKMDRMPGTPGEPRGPRPPHVEALKVAFITQKLNLTAEEAQKVVDSIVLTTSYRNSGPFTIAIWRN